MNKKLSFILTAVGMFMFTLGFMLASVDFAITNPLFYNAAFAKHESAMYANISSEDAYKLSRQMVAYFSGNADSLQVQVTFFGDEEPTDFYGADEISHMHDVKLVVTGVRFVATMLLLAGFALVSLLVVKENDTLKQTIKKLCNGSAIGSGVFLLLLGLLALAILPNFEQAFIVFHEIFFPQGNWAFSSNTPMILLLPDGLFLDATILILASGLGFALLSASLGLVGTIIDFKKGKA